MNQTENLLPLVASVDEVIRMSGHSRSAVYRAMARGELESFKSGRRRLILTKALEDWLGRLAKAGAR